MEKRPLIGISMDHETVQTYSKFPWYALRQNYASSVSDTGGMPFPLSHELSLMDDYLDMIDGLIITGGAFDVSPELYGKSLESDTVSVKDVRTQFEWGMCQGALDRDIPILGICGGQQLLNVVLGGTLIQHLPDVIRSDIEHEQPNPRDEAGHIVQLVSGSQLYSIVNHDTCEVNSAHHQAVDAVGEGVIINARAPDGVIEGIEYPAHPFCIGVQWHPEFFIGAADRVLYEAFISACS